MKISIIYQKVGEADRDIEALISYINEDVEKQTRGRVPTVNIIVRNNSITGISSDEFDTGTDKISIPPRQGMARKSMRIIRMISQNCGFVRFACK